MKKYSWIIVIAALVLLVAAVAIVDHVWFAGRGRKWLLSWLKGTKETLTCKGKEAKRAIAKKLAEKKEEAE